MNPAENPTKVDKFFGKKKKTNKRTNERLSENLKIQPHNHLKHKTLTISKLVLVKEQNPIPICFEISFFPSDRRLKHQKPHQNSFESQPPWYRRIAWEFREISEMEFASCTLFPSPLSLSLPPSLPIAKTLRTNTFSLKPQVPSPYLWPLQPESAGNLRATAGGRNHIDPFLCANGLLLSKFHPSDGIHVDSWRIYGQGYLTRSLGLGRHEGTSKSFG